MERAIVDADQIHSPDRVPSGTISKTLRDLGSVHPAGVVVPAFDAAITTDTTAAHAKARELWVLSTHSFGTTTYICLIWFFFIDFRHLRTAGKYW